MTRYLAVLIIVHLLAVRSPICWAGGPVTSPNTIAIEVSNVKPTGNVTGNQDNTVTADVGAGFPDGTVLPVTITVFNDSTNPVTKVSISTTVTVSGGKGTVNWKVPFPPGSPGQKGRVVVVVTDPDDDENTGTASGNITYQ